MQEVELSKIVIDDEKKEQVIVLKEKEGTRIVPIVIGMNEVVAIKLKLSGFSPPRPLTHDLFCSVLKELRVNLNKVIIDNLLNGTFHAKLYLQGQESGSHIVDARPSDSIALAVRFNTPIFIEEVVFEKLSLNIEDL
ncbi:MAG: bifunctional nuclease family protein [Candidatus Omnitrophica bacterium]|nr:bifunctional nuclease family protein [Candidatus Omnitrophota bacterium]MBD3269303.1 bifunctional nuclease family protein [Candidatus Omnitrophota bacterium]